MIRLQCLYLLLGITPLHLVCTCDHCLLIRHCQRPLLGYQLPVLFSNIRAIGSTLFRSGLVYSQPSCQSLSIPAKDRLVLHTLCLFLLHPFLLHIQDLVYNYPRSCIVLTLMSKHLHPHSLCTESVRQAHTLLALLLLSETALNTLPVPGSPFPLESPSHV